jgi:hypothetical protein
MSRRTAQSGQALVGTLAVMMLVFGLAGGIALAASTLLDDQSSHSTAIARDLRAEDVVSAEVAHVAGHGATGSLCQSTATWTDLLPEGYTSQATCARFDQVVAPALGSIVLPWMGGCASAALPPSQGQNVWLFFNALAGSGITAWIDGNASCTAGAYAHGDCKFSAMSQVVQARIPCGLGEFPSPVVHVMNQVPSPSTVRFTGYSGNQTGQNQVADADTGGRASASSDGTGSIYELVGTTPLSAGTYEEAFVFVSRDGRTTQLLAQGTLG